MRIAGARALPVGMLAFCALASVPPGAARAAECGRDATQFDLDRCAAADFSKADAALNNAYAEIVQRLDDAGGRKRLVAAQRAWLAFREAECDFTTADARDGSVYPTLVADCKATLTKARTRTLAGYLDCAEGDLACPLPPK